MNAMTYVRYTIDTAKGTSHPGTLADTIAWQCEMQGSFAAIRREDGVSVDVDHVDFDDYDRTIEEIVEEVEALFAAE